MNFPEIHADSNCPEKAGQLASLPHSFGPRGRFTICAVHTRFRKISWFVKDSETLDDKDFPVVVRQADTLSEALEGLNLNED
jgi:hypothetical protein